MFSRNKSHSCGLVGSDGLENKQMLNYPYHTVSDKVGMYDLYLLQ